VGVLSRQTSFTPKYLNFVAPGQAEFVPAGAVEVTLDEAAIEDIDDADIVTIVDEGVEVTRLVEEADPAFVVGAPELGKH